ncbi:hypothetical protein CBR_g49073 [Chara braunii]|uniref:GH16 domain-containing protein n=1 Tax=Chara braunii TaxID=69332 RepID=A0A388M4G7_CHABU|nr:hypothetical protein CBR_g49073 [Chara braunii]|eukprot:GBG89363.1 hypothetical protein CBR_g49073 [Chara braunii]
MTSMVSTMALLLIAAVIMILMACGHTFGDGGMLVAALDAQASQENGAAAASSSTVIAASSSDLSFSGRLWHRRTSAGVEEPGPNHWDGRLATVDEQGKLHLTICRNAQGGWSCTEVLLASSLGYGTYTVQVSSPINGLHKNVMLGLFTYADDAQSELSNTHREFDVDVAKWGVASEATNIQYAIQPYQLPGQRLCFTVAGQDSTIHAMTWSPSSVSWTSTSSSSGVVLETWSFGSSPEVGAVPSPGGEVFHINLWLFGASLPEDRTDVEVVIHDFSFTPLKAPGRKLFSHQRYPRHHRPRSSSSP